MAVGIQLVLRILPEDFWLARLGWPEFPDWLDADRADPEPCDAWPWALSPIAWDPLLRCDATDLLDLTDAALLTEGLRPESNRKLPLRSDFAPRLAFSPFSD